MLIYEIIANLFILSISLVMIACSSFILFIAGDVAFERAGIEEGPRQLVVGALILIVIIIIT